MARGWCRKAGVMGVWGHVWLWGAVLGLGGAALSGCSRLGSSSGPPPVAVRLLKVKTAPLKRPIVVFGQTEAFQRSNLAFQVSGMVAKVHVEEGDPVKQGTVLATLDKESIKLNLRLSKARYYEAAASYRKVKKGYRKEVVQQYYAAYRRAKAAYDKARSDYRSSRRLAKKGAISKEQLTSAKTNFDSAKASMNQAYQAYKMYLRGYQKEDIQVAGVRSSQARTQVALAKKQLRDTELHAPFEGVVAQKSIGVGELVSSQRMAFVLMDLRKLRIQVGVPERVIENISLGQKALVFLRPGQLGAIGKLARKGVIIDRATLTYPVEIEVDNPIVRMEDKKPIRRLLPGKVVLVAFPRQNPKKGIAIPLDAVLNDGAKKAVFVVVKGKAKRVEVQTAETYQNNIVVSKGLKDGDLVVVAGQHQLEDGRGTLTVSVGGAK